MTSFDYKYQNALRQAIVFSIVSFVKNRSCVTQIYITNTATKCILVVVVIWCKRHIDRAGLTWRAAITRCCRGVVIYFILSIFSRKSTQCATKSPWTQCCCRNSSGVTWQTLLLRRSYTGQFFMQLVSQFCCCRNRCRKYNLILLFATIEATLLSTFSTLRSVTPPVQLVSQCFVRSTNQDPYFPLLGPARSQFCELLAVPLHSVTALFVQLQCYAFKRCETSCTRNSLV